MSAFVEWGSVDGQVGLRVSGVQLDQNTGVHVYPSEALRDGMDSKPPAMSGTTTIQQDAMWFFARFGFSPGMSYTVHVRDGDAFYVLRIELPLQESSPSQNTRVLAIYPTAQDIPVNQLRFYVQFSAPMSDGFAERCVHVVDAASQTDIPGALLPMHDELWDRERRRLTILLDPGRIKQGLRPNLQDGYPLREGTDVILRVDEAFVDSSGSALVDHCERRYRVGPEIRTHVDPRRWTVTTPPTGTATPLLVDFDRPLDHALLQHSIRVLHRAGREVAGRAGIGSEERSWALFPDQAWTPGDYRIEVDHRLEDLAGNSASRMFDRDLDRSDHDRIAAHAAVIDFVIESD